MAKLTYPYITIDINGNIGDQLFQLAHVINFLRNSKKTGVKRKLVFEDKHIDTCDPSDLGDQCDSKIIRDMYWNTMFKGLFKVLDKSEYNKLKFYKIEDKEDEYSYVNKATQDLELNTLNCQTFSFIDHKLREKMIKIVYNNEDIMYPAYYKYRDILDFFGKDTKDDDIISLHITKDCDDEDIEYYKEALKISGKRNVSIFTDEIDWYKTRDIVDSLQINCSNCGYQFYYVPKSDMCGDEIDFVLMSMFKNNIIANSTNSLWASYISYYDDKIIIAPQRLVNGNKDILHKYISHII
jgi:hypothetical protein